jgi:EmrB/QacA subfamily drug resistance transporter
MPQLIGARVLQGIGGGGLRSVALAAVADIIPPRERGRYQGTIGIVYAVASVAGPALGGFITDTWSWHWIFYINLPIGVIALVMITLTLRRSNKTTRRSIDYLGAALLAGATTCFLLTLSLGGAELGWTSPGLMAIAVGTLVLATLFFLRERVAPEPVMPLEIFRNRTFLVGTMALAFTFMSLQGASVFFPLFFQFVLGIKASNSGLLTAPMLVGIVISAKSNGRYVYHTGRYRPLQLIGTAVAVLGFCIFAYATASGMGLYVLEPGLLAVGLGLGMVNPNTTVAIQNATDSKHTGAVTAVASFFRSLGGVVGVALSGAILAHGLRSGIAQAQLPANVDPQVILSGGIVQLLALPPDAYRVVVGIYREALATCFAAGILSTAIAFLGTYLLPELELKAKGMTRSFK